MDNIDLTEPGVQPFHMPSKYFSVMYAVAQLLGADAKKIILAGGAVRDILLDNEIKDLDFVVGEKDVKSSFDAQLSNMRGVTKGLRLHPKKETRPDSNVLRLYDDISRIEVDVIYIDGKPRWNAPPGWQILACRPWRRTCQNSVSTGALSTITRRTPIPCATISGRRPWIARWPRCMPCIAAS